MDIGNFHISWDDKTHPSRSGGYFLIQVGEMKYWCTCLCEDELFLAYVSFRAQQMIKQGLIK